MNASLSMTVSLSGRVTLLREEQSWNAPTQIVLRFLLKTTLEGGAFGERALLDDCEIIGESDTREGEALFECVSS